MDVDDIMAGMKPAVIDLFCGIGGLSLGAVRAGFRLALAVDKEPVLLNMHKLNFPRFPHSDADVSKLGGNDLLKAAKLAQGTLAGLIGGSPCQGFSRIGKRDHKDERNFLFGHFFRLVSELRPAFFVAENVPGILDSRNNGLVNQAQECVRGIYQLLEPLVLDASDFGAPTVRKRVFFIGYLLDRFEPLTARDFEREKWSRKTTVEIALSGLPLRLRDSWQTDENGWRSIRVKRRGRYWTSIYGDVPEGVGDKETLMKFQKDRLVSGCITTLHTTEVKERFGQVSEGGVDYISRAQRLRRNGQCPTLRAGTGPDRGSFQALRPIHYKEPRAITPREAARLQGFPDWFRFDSTKWHAFRGIGNSVSPLVAEAIFRTIHRKLKQTAELKASTNDKHSLVP
jgi:DNA (cytosine-5)-methyltransferase 1